MINRQGFTFYPEDWLDDAKLKHCSLAAKGMWIDLLCHMHRGDPYGYMVFRNKVMSRFDIQNMLMVTNEEVFTNAFQELFDKGILLQDKATGAYYSKRMLQEHKKNKRRASDLQKSEIFPVVKDIVEHLNLVSGRSFPTNNLETFELIENWLKQGRTVRDFKIVNEVKSQEWMDNDRMQAFIRPRTLYGDKFMDYLNQNPNHKLQNGQVSRKWTIGNYYNTTNEKDSENGQNKQ
ncbi:MAG: conserved phage C-terminal domain-containing protein [bacterium]|nr:conserved phage C-terminal domain-containing protein [bacterium]